MSRLGIDVDGVLADFNSAFISRIITVTGKDLFPSRPFDIPVWDYPQYYGYTGAELSVIWDNIKNDSRFWEQLPPYANTRDSLCVLHDRIISGDDVYFITNRMGLRAKIQTERWLTYQWPCAVIYPLTVLLSGTKGLCAEALKLDKYIDDRWENCMDVVERPPATETYLLTRPWNTQVKTCALYGVTRISALSEMFV